MNRSSAAGERPDGGPSFRAGFWRLADPKISLASAAAMFLGGAVAAANGPLHWGWLALTVFGIFALEVAKNASGEVFDFDSGTDLAVANADRSPFSGGKRVLVDGLLTRRQTIAIAAVCYAVGTTTGLAIVWLREPGVLWIGLVGLACAYFYHAPPARLAYRGLGELAVAICYGPLITSGTCLVQRGTLEPAAIWLSVPLALLIAAFLWINEFPDYAADKATGKRTLVVRLGRKRASRVFAGMVLFATAWTVCQPWGGLPAAVTAGALGAIPGFKAAAKLWRQPHETRAIIPAQALTLLAFLLYALGAGLGYWFGVLR